MSVKSFLPAILVFGGCPATYAQLPTDLDISQLGDDGITWAGPSLMSKLGSCVAGGFDLDGDGYDDVLLGANRANPPGRPAAGCGFIMRGAQTLTLSVDLGNPPLGTTVIWGAEAGDGLGTAARGGFDFNGDGDPDAVITAWAANPLSRSGAGVAAILLGGAPLPPVIDLASPPSSVILIAGPTAGHGLGVEAKPAGDVDGDGFDDLLLGASFADPLGRKDAGVAWIIRGGATSPAILDLASPGNRAISFLGAAPGDRFGESAAGDLTIGGMSAIALGAPQAGANQAGRVFVLTLSSPLPTQVDLATPGSAAITIIGSAFGEQCGSALGNGGDLNHDGSNELLVCAMRGSTPSANGRGRVDVLDLSAATAVVDLASVTPMLRVLGAASSAQLGYSIADAFDGDGDSSPDLFIGMRGFDLQTTNNAGAAVLITGVEDLMPVVDLSNPPPGVHLFHGAATSEHLGYDVDCAGDLDRSGFSDLLIGAINAEPFAAMPTGAAYAVFDQITSVALDTALTGTAINGGSLLLDLRAEPGDAIHLILGTTVLTKPVSIYPHQYGLWVDPATMIIVGPIPVIAPSGELSLTFPFPPVPALLGVAVAIQAFAERIPSGAFSNLREVSLP